MQVRSSPEVSAIMKQVRRRALERRKEKVVEQIVGPELDIALGTLYLQLENLRQSVGLIGAMPPSGPSIRARVGAFLVVVVRRALFWLIPPLKSAHETTLIALEAQYKALSEISKVLRYMNDRFHPERNDSE